MTTPPNVAAYRSLVSLEMSRKVPALLTRAENIVQAMMNDPSLPSYLRPWLVSGLLFVPFVGPALLLLGAGPHLKT